MKHPAAALWVLLPWMAAAVPVFTAEPRVAGDGRDVGITFAVRESTDVDVAVLDATSQRPPFACLPVARQVKRWSHRKTG